MKALIACNICWLWACGAAEDTPRLHNLKFEPRQLRLAEPTAIAGTFDFEDKNADSGRVSMAIIAPNEHTMETEPFDADDTVGYTRGTVFFSFSITPELVGEHTLEVWMVDSADNESNRLNGVFSVEHR